jgi:hypothetical protein
MADYKAEKALVLAVPHRVLLVTTNSSRTTRVGTEFSVAAPHACSAWPRLALSP